MMWPRTEGRVMMIGAWCVLVYPREVQVMRQTQRGNDTPPKDFNVPKTCKVL
jgi:hypothetical protein